MASHPIPRLLNLDLLRLVSALFVVFYHFGFRMAISGEGGGIGFSELSPVAMWLDMGLLVFFAISGYVITLSADGRSAFDFAVGRVARLWPTFMLCAGVTAVVLYNWPVSGLPEPSLKQWLAHAVIISRLLGQPFLDGAYWTIAYEVIFYAWVFLFILLGWFRPHWRIIAAFWLMISVVNEMFVDSEVLRKLFITEYSGYFVFGVALFRLRQQADRAGFLVLAAAALWATATPFIIEATFFELYGVHRPVIGLAVLGPLSLGLVTLAVFAPALPIRPALATALGGLTYPLYLLHQNIGYAVFARFGEVHGRWLTGAMLLLALLAASFAIATYVEPPARRFIRQAGALFAARQPRLRRGG